MPGVSEMLQGQTWLCSVMWKQSTAFWNFPLQVAVADANADIALGVLWMFLVLVSPQLAVELSECRYASCSCLCVLCLPKSLSPAQGSS